MHTLTHSLIFFPRFVVILSSFITKSTHTICHYLRHVHVQLIQQNVWKIFSLFSRSLASSCLFVARILFLFRCKSSCFFFFLCFYRLALATIQRSECVYRNISPLSHTKRIPLYVFMLVTFEKHVEHNNNGFVAGTNMLCPHIASCNI